MFISYIVYTTPIPATTRPDPIAPRLKEKSPVVHHQPNSSTAYQKILGVGAPQKILEGLYYCIVSYYNTIMNQTIYFRKEIWNRLKDEQKKSELINELLAEHYKEPRITDKDINKIAKTIDKQKTPDVIYPTKRPAVCKHGYDPMMCKFAKNGQPCK